MLQSIINVLHVAICVFLILIVLLQQSKGGGINRLARCIAHAQAAQQCGANGTHRRRLRGRGDTGQDRAQHRDDQNDRRD